MVNVIAVAVAVVICPQFPTNVAAFMRCVNDDAARQFAPRLIGRTRFGPPSRGLLNRCQQGVADPGMRKYKFTTPPVNYI
jgi:hypothetical protein